MPAILANATQFLMNSDYPFDNVIALAKGSFTISNNTMGQLTIVPHSLGFAPLPGGNWSMLPDFSLQYEYATGTFPGPPGFYNGTVSNVYADATNFYISTDNPEVTTKTIYYRIFALQPSTDNSSLPPLASQGDNFLLNTSYNNTKILLSDITDLPATPSVSANVAIYHGLSYIPQVLGWVTYQGATGPSTSGPTIHPIGSTNIASQNILLSVNSTNINFTIPAFVLDIHRAYFRVYLDS